MVVSLVAFASSRTAKPRIDIATVTFFERGEARRLMRKRCCLRTAPQYRGESDFHSANTEDQRGFPSLPAARMLQIQNGITEKGDIQNA